MVPEWEFLQLVLVMSFRLGWPGKKQQLNLNTFVLAGISPKVREWCDLQGSGGTWKKEWLWEHVSISDASEMCFGQCEFRPPWFQCLPFQFIKLDRYTAGYSGTGCFYTLRIFSGLSRLSGSGRMCRGSRLCSSTLTEIWQRWSRCWSSYVSSLS